MNLSEVLRLILSTRTAVVINAGNNYGCLGAQRSGKTLFAYKLVKAIHEAFDVPVYSNIYSPRDDFHYINSLEDFPLDLNPKILFIDEIYNGLDAQDYKKAERNIYFY